MPYGDFDSFKVIEGSGGGGLSIQQPSDGGAGGGFIWMQSYSLIFNNAELYADGGASSDPANSYVGAGSGGTVFLASTLMNGTVLISA